MFIRTYYYSSGCFFLNPPSQMPMALLLFFFFFLLNKEIDAVLSEVLEVMNLGSMTGESSYVIALRKNVRRTRLLRHVQ